MRPEETAEQILDRIDPKRRKARTLEQQAISTRSPALLHGQPVPRRLWCVEDFIPDHNVTALFGDGGVGKSLIAKQLQVAAALPAPWLGIQMEPRRSLGIYCEEDEGELHRRWADIASHYGRDLDALGDVHYESRVEKENLLVTFDRNEVAALTPLYDALMEKALDLKVRLVVLDALHDLFGGNEILRSHARQFVGCLRRLALKINGAVLLCAHPSLAGLSSGSGTSGSTAWNNAVRSRLYLTRPSDDADNADANARTLRKMKANYSPLGNEIALTWRAGVFVCNAPGSDPYGQAEAVFLACLDKTIAQNGYASPASGSPAYAPRIFTRMPQAKNFNRKNLERAMQRLLADGRIIVVQHQKLNRHYVEAIAKK